MAWESPAVPGEMRVAFPACAGPPVDSGDSLDSISSSSGAMK